ncbi:MAG TPA: lyase family protein [Acidimicrobiales bacterium]|nr:lyase family protein [Acidimicrobiales bacterium]
MEASGATTSLFETILVPDELLAATSDGAFVAAMLEVERELAAAEAELGLIPPAAATAIASACDGLLGQLDPAELGRAGRAAGNPVPPLARAIGERLDGEAEAYVHFGATSQDILDSASMLVARRAGSLVLAALQRCASSAAALAAGHRSTVLAGRTLLQQALPTTFGLKAAGWLVALDGAAGALAAVLEERLAVQLGGAVGTAAALGGAGPAVAAALAARLGLAEPVLAWHTDRTRLGELAGALGVAAGAAGKVALDVVLLAQSEVGEAYESGEGRGGSSTLPHKRNPVSAVLAVAGARRAPPLVASLLASMLQEHERAAGSWHAEWEAMGELLRAAGGAASNAADSLELLEVVPAAMRANLEAARGVLLAEAVMIDLAPDLGRRRAHELVEAAARRAVERQTTLSEELAGEEAVVAVRSPERLDMLCDASSYLGASDELIDRALASHAAGAASARRGTHREGSR